MADIYVDGEENVARYLGDGGRNSSCCTSIKKRASKNFPQPSIIREGSVTLHHRQTIAVPLPLVDICTQCQCELQRPPRRENY